MNKSWHFLYRLGYCFWLFVNQLLYYITCFPGNSIWLCWNVNGISNSCDIHVLFIYGLNFHGERQHLKQCWSICVIYINIYFHFKNWRFVILFNVWWGWGRDFLYVRVFHEEFWVIASIRVRVGPMWTILNWLGISQRLKVCKYIFKAPISLLNLH